MAQSWNNVLSYIHMGLGVPLNMLEISDSDIINLLKEHVLPYFSQFCPWEKWVFLGPQHALPIKIGEPTNRFKIPKKVDEPILDILEVVYGSQGVLTQEYGMIPFSTMGAIEQVIANTYVDAIRSIGVKQTWQFIPPDILILDQSLRDWSITTGNFY